MINALKFSEKKTGLSNEQIATAIEDDHHHYKDDHNEIFYDDKLVVVSELVEQDRLKTLKYLTNNITIKRIKGWMGETAILRLMTS